MGGEENRRTPQDEGGQPILFLLNRHRAVKLNLHLMVPKSSVLADVEKPFVGCPKVTNISSIQVHADPKYQLIERSII